MRQIFLMLAFLMPLGQRQKHAGRWSRSLYLLTMKRKIQMPSTSGRSQINSVSSMRSIFLSFLLAILPLLCFAQMPKAGTEVPDAELKAHAVDYFFTITPIDDATFARMQKGGSYPQGCPILRSDLRYVRVLHYDYEGRVKYGELVCNKAIAKDLKEIFRELYDSKYQIDKMLLIDEYGADDERSMSDNNSSCFCYRKVSGTASLSKHAYGLAIDINTNHNPYVRLKADGSVRSIEPHTEVARRYSKRTPRQPHMIDTNDLCYKAFIRHGFTWGGAWRTSKDYQHFQKTK